jgi:type IV pilus assembly protein PilA
MLKKIRNKKGFTLIELMIVVAIVGILAAIAIPAYIDYTIKAKLSEVSNAFDALATAVSEYHAAMGNWPQYAGAAIDQLVALPNRRATIQYTASAAGWTTYTGTIANIATAVNGDTLIMNISYAQATGYTKVWDPASTLDNKYMPRQ